MVSDPLSQFLMDVLGVQYNGEDHYNLAPMSRVPILIQSEQKETEVLPMHGGLFLIGRIPPRPNIRCSMRDQKQPPKVLRLKSPIRNEDVWFLLAPISNGLLIKE